MWKVKRMNTARIVDLTIANGAGGIAAFLASRFAAPGAPVAPPHAMQTKSRPAGTAHSHFINLRRQSIRAVRYGAAGAQAMQTRPRGQTI
jgi:hypothetical protein